VTLIRSLAKAPAALLLIALTTLACASRASTETIAALPSSVTAGVGAPLNFVEYEAENAGIHGRIVGPDRTFGTLAAEASGRRAVLLESPRDFVEFTLAKSANALTVRYAVPDTPPNTPDAGLDVYARSQRIAHITTTSRYCCYYGRYPFTKHPEDGNGHHFFDHARILLEQVLPAGAVVRLARSPESEAAWCAIDLADFELVPPPLTRPSRSISVVDLGADASGKGDSRPAFIKAISQGTGTHRPVWIPRGHFRLEGHLLVDRVELAGAGPWYSILEGAGVGLYGHDAPRPSQAVDIHDLSIIGDVQERDDHQQLAGIGGALGGGSRVRNVFIQHVKVGLWLDGPFDGLRVSGVQVVDTTADGLNLHRGISHVIVEDSFFRNTGDDGIASWAAQAANHDIVIRHNTVVAPILANGVAIYGGHDIAVTDNLIADTLTEGGGLHVGNRFGAVPLSGKISIRGNMVVRGGGFDPGRHLDVGAVWLYALDAPIHAQIELQTNTLLDSSHAAVLLFGKRIDGLTVKDLHAYGAQGPLMEVRADGSATVSGVEAIGVVSPAMRMCGTFLLDWEGSTGTFTQANTQGC
jgi:Pectate lyase superfamily protein